MSRAGVRRAVGVIAAAHRSYSSCTQYRENVADARAALARAGLPDIEITYAPDWFDHPRFIDANATRLRDAIATLDAPRRARAHVAFTAHSIPESMAAQYPYREQYETTARLVMEKLGGETGRGFSTVYQSRSGRPEDPWLGPDIGEYLREARAQGVDTVVVAPIGFICDHVEVLYDLDVEASEISKEIGMTMVRAQSVNDHPTFLEMLADVVLRVCRRYERAVPLELVR
jgi:ferrochelatase